MRNPRDIRTRPNIRELEAIERNATPGPWAHDHIGTVLTENRVEIGVGVTSANGQFIAAVRNVLPDLLAYVRELEAKFKEDVWIG